MTRGQIQPTSNRQLSLARPVRRSLWGQIWTALLQPGLFFRTMSPVQENRQWLWAGVLILALIGISAVRYEALTTSPITALPGDASFGPPPGTDLGGEFGGSGGEGFPGIESPLPVGQPTGADSGITATWTTALVAASSGILHWIILAVLLCEVSLFNGRAPRLGHNFQIAIWSSLPLGVMSLVQLIYFSAGGTPGQEGITGLLPEWSAYTGFPHLVQSLILSLSSRLTIFWGWSLILVYVGARNALRGKRIAAILVVIAWAIVAVVAPVVTGAIAAPEPVITEEITPELDPSEMLPEFEGSESEFPPGTDIEGLLPDSEDSTSESETSDLTESEDEDAATEDSETEAEVIDTEATEESESEPQRPVQAPESAKPTSES